MITAHYWRLDRSEGMATAPQFGRAFDAAQADGAALIVVGGELFAPICGEWCGIQFVGESWMPKWRKEKS